MRGKRFLNEANLRRTYLQGRMHVLAGTVARTCKDGCTYLQGRMLSFAPGDANVCNPSRKRLQTPSQTFATEDANVWVEMAFLPGDSE